MVDVIFDPSFQKEFQKIKDKILKERIMKQIFKIKENPEIGKPMKYTRRGTRELYIPPFRLSYSVEGNTVYVLEVYHKAEQ